MAQMQLWPSTHAARRRKRVTETYVGTTAPRVDKLTSRKVKRRNHELTLPSSRPEVAQRPPRDVSSLGPVTKFRDHCYTVTLNKCLVAVPFRLLLRFHAVFAFMVLRGGGRGSSPRGRFSENLARAELKLYRLSHHPNPHFAL